MKESEESNQKERPLKWMRRDAKERALYLAEWESSGLSAGQYASRHGLKASDLYRWRMLSRRKGQARAVAEAPGAFMAIELGGNTGMWSSRLRVILRTGAVEFELSGASSVTELAALAGAVSREVVRG